MRKDEPHLYTSTTWICYSGKPHPTVSYPNNGFPLFDRLALCLLRDVKEVRITPTKIIFCIQNEIEYAIPHTPETYKECRKIFLTDPGTCGILKE